jgi:transposase
MNEYPNKNSVIVMDNAKIHHDEKLVESIEQMGCKVLYLPPYSPDYNPIETAFSGIKLWLKRNRVFVKNCNDPKYPLLLALSQVTPDMAKGYYKGSSIYYLY